MRWPQQISFPALFPLVVLTALAPIILAEPAAAVANLSADAQTLLQEQAWAEAFQWNSSTNMCHQWFGVECDDSESHVLALSLYPHPFGRVSSAWKLIQHNLQAASLVLPDSWSNLTHLQLFEYSVDAQLAGPLPSSWSKLENISEISIYAGPWGAAQDTCQSQISYISDSVVIGRKDHPALQTSPWNSDPV